MSHVATSLVTCSHIKWWLTSFFFQLSSALNIFLIPELSHMAALFTSHIIQSKSLIRREIITERNNNNDAWFWSILTWDQAEAPCLDIIPLHASSPQPQIFFFFLFHPCLVFFFLYHICNSVSFIFFGYLPIISNSVSSVWVRPGCFSLLLMTVEGGCGKMAEPAMTLKTETADSNKEFIMLTSQGKLQRFLFFPSTCTVCLKMQEAC